MFGEQTRDLEERSLINMQKNLLEQFGPASYQSSSMREQAVDLPESAPYFDAVAHNYFQRYEERTPGGYVLRVRRQRVEELLDKQGGKVLDLGCGPGVLTHDLVNLGFEYWGMDSSSKMVDECNKNFGHIKQSHFSVGNVSHVDYPDQFFDTVMCLGVIGSINDYETAIGEMFRVLKPDGSLLITLPNRYSPWALWRMSVFYPLVNILRPLYYRLIGRPQPPVLYSGLLKQVREVALKSFAKLNAEGDAIKLIARHAGEVTDVVYYDFNMLLSPLDEIFPRTAMWVAERLESCLSGKLRRLGSGFVLKARKTK